MQYYLAHLFTFFFSKMFEYDVSGTYTFLNQGARFRANWEVVQPRKGRHQYLLFKTGFKNQNNMNGKGLPKPMGFNKVPEKKVLTRRQTLLAKRKRNQPTMELEGVLEEKEDALVRRANGFSTRKKRGTVENQIVYSKTRQKMDETGDQESEISSDAESTEGSLSRREEFIDSVVGIVMTFLMEEEKENK